MTGRTRKLGSSPTAKPADERPPLPDEAVAHNRIAIEKFEAKHKDRVRPPRFKVDLTAGASLATAKIGGMYAGDVEGFSARIGLALGSDDVHFISMLTTQLANATGQPPGVALTDAGLTQKLQQGVGFVRGVAPENEVEAALAVEMYAIHSATMELSRRAASADTLDKWEAYSAMTVKMARTFTAQVEALAKLRSRGKQEVTVVHVHKHVYVAPGGQAIVGDVHQSRPGGTGGGDHLESGGQSDAFGAAAACLSFAPGVPMPGAYEARDPLPVAGGEGPQEVSDAWRDEPWSAPRPGERPLHHGTVDQGDDGPSAGDAGAGGVGARNAG